MIRIFVDSTCDLPEGFFERHNIIMIPLKMLLNGKEFIDKVTIKVSEVYDQMRNGAIPKTSLPNLAEAYDVVYKEAAEGKDCIFLSISDKLSGTYQGITRIFKQVGSIFSDRKMTVIDTKGGSVATGLMAWQSARLASAGRSYEEIVKNVHELVEEVELIFTISDLNWLVKGGRLSKVEGFLGNILHIKPILQVRNGLIEPYLKVRSKKKALRAIVDIVEERIKLFPEQTIGIAHTDDPETANEMEYLLKERLGEIKSLTSSIGSVIGSHLGIGGVGVFFFRRRPALYLD